MEVHEAVDDKRGDLADGHPGRHVERPATLQLTDGRGVDLVELRIPLVVQVQVVTRPVRLAAADGDRGRRPLSGRAPLLLGTHLEATERCKGEHRHRHAGTSAVE